MIDSSATHLIECEKCHWRTLHSRRAAAWAAYSKHARVAHGETRFMDKIRFMATRAASKDTLDSAGSVALSSHAIFSDTPKRARAPRARR